MSFSLSWHVVYLLLLFFINFSSHKWVDLFSSKDNFKNIDSFHFLLIGVVVGILILSSMSVLIGLLLNKQQIFLYVKFLCLAFLLYIGIQKMSNMETKQSVSIKQSNFFIDNITNGLNYLISDKQSIAIVVSSLLPFIFKRMSISNLLFLIFFQIFIYIFTVSIFNFAKKKETLWKALLNNFTSVNKISGFSIIILISFFIKKIL